MSKEVTPMRENERSCPECGGVVNRAATACVHCGAPLNPTTPAGAGSAGTGMDPKLAGALSYLGGFITGILFLLIEKEDDFVRFHAWQAIAFGAAVIVAWIALSIFSIVFAFVPFIGGFLITLAWYVVWLGALALWILLMVKAYQGQRFNLPVLGDLARSWSEGRVR